MSSAADLVGRKSKRSYKICWLYHLSKLLASNVHQYMYAVRGRDRFFYCNEKPTIFFSKMHISELVSEQW